MFGSFTVFDMRRPDRTTHSFRSPVKCGPLRIRFCRWHRGGFFWGKYFAVFDESFMPGQRSCSILQQIRRGHLRVEMALRCLVRPKMSKTARTGAGPFSEAIARSALIRRYIPCDKLIRRQNVNLIGRCRHGRAHDPEIDAHGIKVH